MMSRRNRWVYGCRYVLLATLITFALVSMVAVKTFAQEPYPPSPQKEVILPESWSVFTGTINFVYDFDDLENDIYCLKIDIYGPSPYNTSNSKIELIFSANETDPWSMMDSANATLYRDGMGIDVTYYNSTERWVVTIDTTKMWNMSNPWLQPNGSAVWPAGVYVFNIEVDDEKGNRWGDVSTTPLYAQFVYSFHRIQPAIDEIGSGGTIRVLAGVYEESLVIDKPLTLLGFYPLTILRPTSAPSPGVYDIEFRDGSSNSTIKGFILDFNGVDGSRGGNGIIIGDSASSIVKNIKIIDNTIYAGNASSSCIRTYSGCDAGGLLIEGNTIYGTGASGGIHISSLGGGGEVTVYGNEMYGEFSTAVAVESSDVAISCNVIDSNVSKGVHGVLFTDSTGGQTYTNVSIVSNEIRNFTYGIKLGTDTDVGSSLSAVVGSNTVTMNDVGILTGYGFSSGIHKNNLYGNANYGLRNIASTPINATLNWWGNDTGPYHPTNNPGGTGDNVSDNVIFSDWLTSKWENQVWVDDFYDQSTPGWGIDHFNNLEDGIGAVFDGGIVNVKPARYQEVIRIDKPLTLKSVYGTNLTIISDAGANYSEMGRVKGQTIQIASSHVTIDGFTVKRENYAAGDPMGAIGNVGFPDLHDIVIKNCYIYSIYDGVHLINVSDVEVSYNERIIGYWKGVYLNSAEKFTIEQNLLDTTASTGVAVYNSRDGEIKNNYIKKKTTGVRIVGCSDITIQNEKVHNNTNGIYIDNSTDISVKYTSIKYNTYGLRLAGHSRTVEEGNAFLDNVYSIYHAVENREKLYSCIQDGINHAGVGDTITVYYGEYKENVIIEKNVTLEGYISAEDVIINGTDGNVTVYIGKDENVSDVTLKKLTIVGGVDCIRTGRYMNVSGLKIEKCIIKEPRGGYAVYIDPHQNPDYPPIRPGPQPFPKPVALYDNFIRGGVFYQYTPFELYGVPISCQLALFYNDIDEVYINGSVSVIVDNNTIHTLIVRNTYDISITNNRFVNPSGVPHGIVLLSVEGENPVKKARISHNSIIGYDGSSGFGDVGDGILVVGSKEVIIESNHFEANINGIVITENYRTGDGLNCSGDVKELVVRNNSIKNCYAGLRLLSDANGTIIENNFIVSNGYGIWLSGSGHNTIANNTVIDGYYGIKMDEGSSYNLIYNNYFANNTVNAYDPYSFNTWNISLTNGTNIMGGKYLGGNYWDDYTGEDLDGDSIGDTDLPYNASGNIKHGGDYLPIVYVDNIPPTVEVIYPNGGEVINGSTILIQWEAEDDKDPDLIIDLYYSNDSGNTWNLIVPNISNSGEYLWNISRLPDGCGYMVKVVARDNAGNIGNDTSDSTFCIARVTGPGPKVEIIKPKMGFIYFFDVPKARFFRNNIFIIGHITVEAKVNSTVPVKEVRFYIDGDLMNVTNHGKNGVFSWEWDETALFYHEITVKAIDTAGRSDSTTVGVTIFNFNIIP